MKDPDAGGMQRRSYDEGQSRTIFESVLFTSTSHTTVLEKRCKTTDATQFHSELKRLITSGLVSTCEAVTMEAVWERSAQPPGGQDDQYSGWGHSRIQKCFPSVIYGASPSGGGELSRKYRSAYCRMWSTALSRSTSVLSSTSSSEE